MHTLFYVVSLGFAGLVAACSEHPTAPKAVVQRANMSASQGAAANAKSAQSC